ncbi:MAG TPA: glycosyltransferase family 39 protein [Thermoanaerobaculia bacterium]|nr:glycosyltransferase family 39 protein [Thermoanaerobaculia bacterium]
MPAGRLLAPTAMPTPLIHSRARLVAMAMVLLCAYSLALRVWCGVRDLNASRYYDEGFSLRNVGNMLDTGSLRPANAYYPGLSYLPEAAVLAAVDGLRRATGLEALAIRSDEIDSRGHFTPLAYLLCRLFQALLGTASLIALFCLGRRHLTPAAGLAGAFIMSIVPWHIRQSSIFKPDILLVLTTILALDWSIRALRSLGHRDFAVAGLAIGACASAKYSGIAGALPLTAVALTLAASEKCWTFYGKRLALAGLAAAACFALTNPYALADPDLVRQDFGSTLVFYAGRGARAQASHLDMPANAVASLLSGSFLGLALGTLGLCGVAVWGFKLLGRLGHSKEQAAARTDSTLPLAVLALFPLAYVFLYSAVTNYPSEHNWLPLVPVISLAAADLILGSGSAVAALPALAALPARRRFPGRSAILAGALVVYGIYASFSYARTIATPPTWSLARDYLQAAMAPEVADRIVAAEDSDQAALDLRDGNRSAAVFFFDAAQPPAASSLEAADAEVHRGGRQAQSARCRPLEQDRAGGRCLYFEPSLLGAHGEPLTAIVHLWKPLGDPVTLAPRGPRCSYRLPAPLPPGATLGSLQTLLPRGQATDPPSGRLGRLSLPLVAAGRAHGSSLFSSARFPLQQLDQLTLDLLPRPCQAEEVRLLLWQ